MKAVRRYGPFLSLLLCLGLALPAAAQSGRAMAGNFDFFVLSLSWSPGFCTLEGGAKDVDQCAPGNGLGFVVHGLWPQNEHGFPSDCDAATRNPSRAALAETQGVYPDIGLARYEWRKHGTCTGESPTDYFRDVKRARDTITIPAAFQAPQSTQSISPNAIARAFFDANPRLRPGMMAVTCKRNVLEEVRICLTKDLRGFRACPEVVRMSCRSQQVSVPSPG